MIDKASMYFQIFPRIHNLSQLEKGMNLVYNKSKTGIKLIEDSLNNLDKIDKKFTKSEIELMDKSKDLIKKK